MTSFSALNLPENLSRAMEVLAFTEMTPVQAEALPPILAGRDVTAQARTGTGKTVAFGLGVLAGVDVELSRIQALILCPTRELADQVAEELRRLARFTPNFRIVTLCGGVPCRTQAPSLQIPPHVVVGTPGRILDHLERQNLEFSALRTLVLDEADRMLDMGFSEAIADVVAQVPAKRQTLFFSATFPAAIRTMSKRLQQDALQVTVEAAPESAEIEQLFFEVAPAAKLDTLVQLLHRYQPESALVFCHTRADTRDVAKRLAERGYSVLALHGELEQRERDEVLLRFANQSCSILVATDVAARGLDIKGLPAVIAWELPKDPDQHVHRIGRTGRAGQKGLALNLCSRSERERAERIEEHLKIRATWMRIEPVSGELPAPKRPPMVTLMIEGGRQQKLRPGDLLGALTGDIGLAGTDVGKIDLHPTRTYVAIRRERSERALHGLRNGKIKARSFKVSLLR